jgi:GntR family transcriptional repressor for pyruvate dehydrogenase complex
VTANGEHGKQPAYQDLADRLRGQILTGVLKAGERLPVEPELSLQHGVSRSTVREALRVLSSQNLLVTTRGVSGGSFVVHPAIEQITDYLQTTVGLLTSSAEVSMDELLEVRCMVEVPSTGLAALRRTVEELEILRGTIVDPRTTDTDALHEANRRFHATLVQAARNPLIEVVAQPMWAVLNERFFRDRATGPFWDEVTADHRAIFEAVESADEDAARLAAQAHLVHLRAAYEELASA